MEHLYIPYVPRNRVVINPMPSYRPRYRHYNRSRQMFYTVGTALLIFILLVMMFKLKLFV